MPCQVTPHILTSGLHFSNVFHLHYMYDKLLKLGLHDLVELNCHYNPLLIKQPYDMVEIDLEMLIMGLKECFNGWLVLCAIQLLLKSLMIPSV